MKRIENGLLTSTRFIIRHYLYLKKKSLSSFLLNIAIVVFKKFDTFDMRARENCKSHSTNNKCVVRSERRERKE